MGDCQLLSQFLDILLADIPIKLRQLSNSLKNHDSKKAHQAVHSLRGSIQNLNCEPLVEALFKLDDMTANGVLPENEELLVFIKTQWNKINSQLKEARGYIKTTSPQ